uniref:DUF3700 domain-containing protein n=1 Tax=Leersia perrieri TaxID=77586 RepID=A0A0D9W046_9ORYZ
MATCQGFLVGAGCRQELYDTDGWDEYGQKYQQRWHFVILVLSYGSYWDWDLGVPVLVHWLFAALDDIFCLFQGTIENIAVLKQQYGLHKGCTEINIIIEAYRTLRDRGPYPADQVVRDINGKFAFVLYDCSNNSVFMATDADGSVPFYWGVDPDDRLVVSDDDEIVKKACGKSSAPFPKGFFFTTSGGLQSYEHPLNEVKPVPRIDSKGEVCGTTYTVDAKAKKDNSIPRVGSAADWSSQY